ncbi:MAG: peptidylprolyl isomerase [bacterium]
MSFISGEIKKLMFTLFGAALLMLGLVWVAGNSQSIFTMSKKIVNTITGTKQYSDQYKYNLDKSKTYYLNIDTNLGKMSFLLYKDNAPNTVNNIVNLTKDKFYDNTKSIEITPNYILTGKGSSNSETEYRIREEINANSLGLDRTTVGDNFSMLSEHFNQQVLNKNSTLSVKDYYVLEGYSYTENITSKKIKKGSLVMYSEVANGFGNKFFISTQNNLPAIDGRMTNFGEIVNGSDVLDKIIASTSKNVKIDSITITEK